MIFGCRLAGRSRRQKEPRQFLRVSASDDKRNSKEMGREMNKTVAELSFAVLVYLSCALGVVVTVAVAEIGGRIYTGSRVDGKTTMF